ncbi:MAG: hypothetical protein ACLVJ6_06440 [Merdibacter sp.]
MALADHPVQLWGEQGHGESGDECGLWRRKENYLLSDFQNFLMFGIMGSKVINMAQVIS